MGGHAQHPIPPPQAPQLQQAAPQTPIIDFHVQANTNQDYIQQVETCPPQSSCCKVDPDVNPPCSCDAIEVPPATSSERSSSYNSCTLPLKPLKGILKKSNPDTSYTLPRDVIPFDQIPPCDDCLQRARSHGSYGDICQNLETDNCGFQMHQRYRNTADEGYCCKHQISTRKGSLGSNMVVVSRQNSYDEKEEVEAVESSV